MAVQEEPGEYISTSLDRALRVINEVVESGDPDIGISELSRATGLSKAVVHRIIRTLVARDFIAYNEETQRYSLGAGALILGLAALNRLDVPRIATAHLDWLVAETRETATLSAFVNDHRVYIDQVLSPQVIRMSVHVGSPVSLFSGGSSHAILAALPDPVIDGFIAKAHESQEEIRFVDGSAFDEQVLRTEIAAIRDRGYAISRGERQVGAASVATAIRLGDGTVFGSMSVCGPLVRFGNEEIERYGKLVSERAAMVSAQLGYKQRIYTA